MNEEERIASINKVISSYFEKNKTENSIAVKELMPYFIEAGVFAKDQKKGLPIRKVLRALDDQDALDKIPLVHPERKDKNTHWYFVREGSTYVSDAPNDTGVTKSQKRRAAVINSDQYYVVNLCDELLQERASRHHRFSFLLGDYHKDGTTRSVLPVDAYYQKHNLVIEYMESYHMEPVDTDKWEKRTISGVGLSEQRKIYAERRRSGLKSNEINILEIPYSSFECTSEKRLIRDQEKDLDVLRVLLKDHL
ncbi:MAG: hypothetical protein ABJG47_13975 [Ekhidna sp.]